MTLDMLREALQQLEQSSSNGGQAHKELIDTAVAVVATMAERFTKGQTVVDVSQMPQGQSFTIALQAAAAIQEELRSLLVHPATTTAINVMKVTFGLQS